ncbi:MAG: DUF1893 domain-containing protein [Candidatus Cryosericum sp.]
MTENERLVQAEVRKGQTTLCAARDGKLVYRSSGRGIADLLQVIATQSGTELQSLDWGDKLIGRAAALLFVLLRPASVFGLTMSAAAEDVLRQAGVSFAHDEVIPEIRNRDNTGPCPMEAATVGVTDPVLALQILTAVNQKLTQTTETTTFREEIL